MPFESERAKAAFNAVVEAMRAKGANVVVENDGITEINGEKFSSPDFRVFHEGRGTGWRRTTDPNARLRITLFRFRNTQQFPEPKTGYDYNKIADALIRWAEYEKSGRQQVQQRNARIEAAQQQFERLIAKFPTVKPFTHGSKAQLSLQDEHLVLTLRWLSEAEWEEALAFLGKFNKQEAAHA